MISRRSLPATSRSGIRIPFKTTTVAFTIGVLSATPSPPIQAGQVACQRPIRVPPGGAFDKVDIEVGTYYTEVRNSYPTAPTPDNKRRDVALAIRFDYSDNLLFKLEAHAIKGTRDMFNVPGISNSPADLKDSMGLFAAKTTISF